MGWRDRAKPVEEGGWRSRAKPVEAAAPAEPAPPPTDAKAKLTAFTRNLVPGLDYVDAASDYVQDRLPEAIGGKPAGQERTFDAALRDNQAYNVPADEANPGAAIAGSAAQAYAMPWAKAKGVIGIGKRAGQEAITAFLMSRGKGATNEESLKNAGTTAALGAGGETAISAAKGVRSLVGHGLKRADTVGALNAVGAVGSDFADLRRSPSGKARIGEIADDLHAEGIVKPGATIEDAEDALEAARTGWGKKVGDVYDELGNLGAQGERNPIIGAARQARLDFDRMAGTDNAKRATDLRAETLHLLQKIEGKAQIPIGDLHQRRMELDDLIYKYGAVKDPSSSLRKTVLQKLRASVQDEIDRAAKSTAAAQAPHLAGELDTAAKKYGTLATATEWAKDAASKRESSQVVPWLAGGAGVAAAGSYASGNPDTGNSFMLSALAALALRKQIEPRLPATISSLSHSIRNQPAFGAAADAIGKAGSTAIRAGAIEAGEPSNQAVREYLRSRGLIE